MRSAAGSAVDELPGAGVDEHEVAHQPSGGKDENTGEDDSGDNAGPFARHKISTQMST